MWPLSRVHAPVELAELSGDGGSLLARAIKNVKQLSNNRIIIAATHEGAPLIKQHIAKHALLEPREYELLVEAYPRGNALTMALVAAHLKLADSQAVLFALPVSLGFEADDRWWATVERAYRAAEDDALVAVGTTLEAGDLEARLAPSSFSHHGCIKRGAELEELPGVFNVRSFVANPTPSYAYRATQQGALWSTHIIAAKATLVLAELKHTGAQATSVDAQGAQRLAETAGFLAALGSDHWSSKEAQSVLATLPAASLEQAVFETTQRLVVVPTSIPFDNRASLMDLEKGLPANVHGNRAKGRVLAVDSVNSTVLTRDEKLVVTLGVEGLVVIDTADALLIASRDALDAMPSVIAQLRSTQAPELLD